MTIEKGREWGEPHRVGARVVTAEDDADLAAKVDTSRRSDAIGVLFTVVSGDLAASLGHGDERVGGHGSANPMVYPMDLGVVEVGRTAGVVDARFPFVAHVMGRRRRWAWPEFVAMNAPLVGGLRLGPRAHPNDGLLDITVGRLPWSQVREARRRARTGTHLPHPALTVSRSPAREYQTATPLRVAVDGADGGTWTWLRVVVEPDAFRLVLPPPV